jgi:LacI family transcriptional regulator, galactose operon repressor
VTGDASPPTLTDRRATMMDVAAAAGVSQTTVSLVLNNVAGARLSSSTRQRVREAAEALSYELVRKGPPEPALGAGVIGIVADEISTDPWVAMALDGVREKAWEHGLTISASVTRGDAELESAVYAQMARQRLAGLVYATIQTRRVPALSAPPVATVLLNCYVTSHAFASLVPGEVLGGYAATTHLIRAGHRRIAHIHGQSWMDASRDRLKGYRRALAEFEIPYDPDLVRPGNWEPSAGHAQTVALMALDRPPTAIFCANDLMALGCYEALREAGLRIPEDVSVVGYDDREIAQFLRPALTTVLLPHFAMGHQAAELLIDGSLRPAGRQPQIKVECPLIARASVSMPPR